MPHFALDVDRSIALARDIRSTLLRDKETPRDLAGLCGLASMLLATVLDDPYALRTGFYMKLESYLNKRGRLPHRHAWCAIGSTIVDATATQFSPRAAAVHVTRHDKDTRYIETASGADAIDDIMKNWRGSEVPAYVELARGLRRRLREERSRASEVTAMRDLTDKEQRASTHGR